MKNLKLILLKLLVLLDILRIEKLKILINLLQHGLMRRFWVSKNRLFLSLFSRRYKSIYQSIYNNDYQKALQIAASFDESKLDSNVLIVIAKVNLRLGHLDEYNRLLQLTLERRTRMSLNELLSRLSISQDSTITSQFSSNSHVGRRNLGIIIHFRNNQPVYLTKFKDMSLQSNKIHVEHSFYLEVLKKYPALRPYAPTFIEYLDFNDLNVSAITIEYIQGRHPTLEDLPLLLDFQHQLQKIDLNSIVLNFKGQIQLSSASTYKSKYYWRYKIERISQILKDTDDSSQKNITELHRIFSKKRIDRSLRDENLYTAQHNDFHASNIIIDESNNRVVVIDWSNISISPIGRDWFAFLHETKCTLNQAYDWIIRPLSLEKSPHTKELASALILDFLHDLAVNSKNILLVQKELDQAVTILKELHQIND
jgi:hypothetical protein